jgi:hypothetical protein
LGKLQTVPGQIVTNKRFLQSLEFIHEDLVRGTHSVECFAGDFPSVQPIGQRVAVAAGCDKFTIAVRMTLVATAIF